MKIYKTDLSRDKRDETIGKALAELIAEEGAPGSCLTDEEMAAIIDGNLVGEERDLLMKHLSSCDRCLPLFRTSHRHLAMKEPQPQRSRFVLPSAGIAIAALLAIVLRISLQGNNPDKPAVTTGKEHAPAVVQKHVAVPSPLNTMALPGSGVASSYSPPSAFETARLLARVGDLKSLLAAIPSDRSPVYGFSGAVPSENRAFRLGVHAADLELFLQVDDREGVVSHLQQIVELLQITNKKQADAARFEEILRKIEGGMPIQSFRNCTATIDKILAANGELFLYCFGVWAEGGRLAAMAGNKDYFTPRSLRYVKDGVKNMQVPPGILKALQEIETVVQKGEFSEKDFLGMKRAFEDVVAIF